MQTPFTRLSANARAFGAIGGGWGLSGSELVARSLQKSPSGVLLSKP